LLLGKRAVLDEKRVDFRNNRERYLSIKQRPRLKNRGRCFVSADTSTKLLTQIAHAWKYSLSRLPAFILHYNIHHLVFLSAFLGHKTHYMAFDTLING
jgi:hypothetical protein